MDIKVWAKSSIPHGEIHLHDRSFRASAWAAKEVVDRYLVQQVPVPSGLETVVLSTTIMTHPSLLRVQHATQNLKKLQRRIVAVINERRTHAGPRGRGRGRDCTTFRRNPDTRRNDEHSDLPVCTTTLLLSNTKRNTTTDLIKTTKVLT